MLEMLGFCGRWIGWKRACLESSSMSVLVNRSPDDFLWQVHRVIRNNNVSLRTDIEAIRNN